MAPTLHGLYRAICSTSFTWTIGQWESLSTQLNALCSSVIVDCLNNLLLDIFRKEDIDVATERFVQTFVSRYVAQERPLSGYFIVCCVIEAQWTVLAQVLAPPAVMSSGGVTEAAAANRVWLYLMREAPNPLNLHESRIEDSLKRTIRYSMQCFDDLLAQIEDMESEPSLDTYTWETMSESLVWFFFIRGGSSA